ncbi:MAG: methyl-accepting chemotaxis protein [Acetobacteraceae bacterium]
MRVLRNLSINLKLALSAGVALLLLTALGLGCLDSVARLSALQSRTSAAAKVVQRLSEADRAGVELRVISREIAQEQTGQGLKRLTDRADVEAGVARDALRQLAGGWQAGSDEARRLAETLQAVDTFITVIGEEAALRRHILLTREHDLLRPRANFEAGLKTFDQELAAGGVLAGGVDAVVKGEAAPAEETPEMLAAVAKARDLFTAYQLGMARVQNAAMMYLATANSGAANEVSDGAAEATKNMAGLLALGLPSQTRTDARLVQTLGLGIAQAATEVVAGAQRLAIFVRTDVERANTVLSDRLGEAAVHESELAEDARTEAGKAGAVAQRRVLLIGAGIALVLLLSSWLTSRAVARPIAAMTRAVQTLAEVDTEVSFGHVGRRDEVGRMAAALERLRGVVRDAFVRSQMIEQIPIGVMTASAEGVFPITYVNRAAVAMMELIAPHLPAPPDQLLGQSVAQLATEPDRQRALLSEPDQMPRTARLALGGETLEMVVSAIRDRTGAYIGPMVTWRRATEQVNLVHRFEATVGAIAQDVGGKAAAMAASAEQMSAGAHEAGGRVAAVARASEQAAASVAAGAAGAEELAASISEIGRQVSESARIASRAVEEAEATDRCVGGLSEAAQRIDDVVRLISDIAGRTNLLALNATIEAARAGEAGKGFAVVASEVKNLAAQTARATGEIGAQISAMQGATGQAVDALRSIGATIGRMSEIATAIAGAVDQQSAATQEIAQAVQHAAAGTSEVTGTIALVSEDVARTGAEAETVQATARELARQSDALKAESDAFLEAVQKAA